MSENDTHAPVEAVSKTNVPSRGILSWGLLVSMLAAYGGIAIQIAGQARHQSWHERFGTDAGLFPWSLDQTIFWGQFSILDRSTEAYKGMAIAGSGLWLPLLITLCVLALLLGVANLPYLKEKRIAWRVETASNLEKYAGMFLSVAIGFASPILALYLVILGLGLPMLFGVASGAESHRKYSEEFKLPCDSRAVDKPQCVELLKDGKSLACGDIIESSPSHIALFEATKQQAIVFERAGTVLRVIKPRTALDKTCNASAPQKTPPK